MTPLFTAIGEEDDFEARIKLSRFVEAQAAGMQEFVGFGWKPDHNAPSDFIALKRAALASARTGKPLPVSDEHSDKIIYISVEINYAFRYWHDLTHVLMDKGFDLDGEIAVSKAHLKVLKSYGMGPGTPEYELLRADTLGQTLCGETTGAFPIDQPCFARRAVIVGLGKAIRAERKGQVLLSQNLFTEYQDVAVTNEGNGTKPPA